MGRESKARDKRNAIEAGIRSDPDPSRKSTRAEVAVGREVVRGLYAQCRDALEPIKGALPPGSKFRDSIDLVRKAIGELGVMHDRLMEKAEAEAPE